MNKYDCGCACPKSEIIRIMYHTDAINRITKTTKGDWIDLRASETIELKAGEFKIIPLGVTIVLPKNHYAMLVPRSSTFKKWGIIQTNSPGIVDESYCGEGDVWGLPVVAMRDTVINVNDAICQFSIFKKGEVSPTITTIEHSYHEDRGGFGSSGCTGR